MEISFRDLKELFAAKDTEENVYPVGKNVFIRTLTMAYTGKLERVTKQELILTSACWIADTGRFADFTGRFADFLAKGKLNECEPFPEGEVVIGRGAIVDCCVWKHALPMTQQ